MVRRIRSCSSCQNRFVSTANEPFCSSCRQLSLEEGTTAMTRTTENEIDGEPSEKRPILRNDSTDLGDDGLVDSNAFSEGEDEVHCTQLDESDQEIQHEEISEFIIPVNETTASIETNYNADQDHREQTNADVCFICGKSLADLKNRVDHIKRCSKKHGITGKDVKCNNDHEEFVVPSEPKKVDLRNPYHNKENAWHGDATFALNLAGQKLESNQSTKSTTQTSLSSYFQAPMRNVNNVLLSGAKRIAKIAEQKSKPVRNFNKRRRSFGGGRKEYSRVSCPTYKRIPSTDFVCGKMNQIEMFFQSWIALSHTCFLRWFSICQVRQHQQLLSYALSR